MTRSIVSFSQAEEERYGPQGIWKADEVKKDDKLKKKKKGKKEAGEADRKDHDADADEAFDAEKLREYELGRMRYYFAVVECTSVEGAVALYDMCDGAEIEVRWWGYGYIYVCMYVCMYV